jgi:hypothetical protein
MRVQYEQAPSVAVGHRSRSTVWEYSMRVQYERAPSVAVEYECSRSTV